MPIEDEKIAQKVEEVLTKKDANGEWVYTQREVRDFIVTCLFELGLDIPQELQGMVIQFMVECGVGDDTEDADIVKAVVGYFEENPLNPQLLVELATWGRDQLFTAEHEGYKEATEQIKALQAAGSKQGKTRAPQADAVKADVKGKVKKGLS
jgi:hypothetical protein